MDTASDGIVVLRIDPAYRDAAMGFLGAMQGEKKKLRVSAVRFIPRKSYSQLRLAHLLFDEIARVTSNDPEDVKIAIKEMVLEKRGFILKDEMGEYTDYIVKSLRACDKRELGLVIEKALSVAAEYGINTTPYSGMYDRQA
jgi:hypothetical protein